LKIIFNFITPQLFSYLKFSPYFFYCYFLNLDDF
jgi:hypothetical protein